MTTAASLKEALHNTIHRNRRSVAELADAAGMSDNYLYRSALPAGPEGGSDSGCRFPLEKLIPLLRAADDLQVLDYIERQLGRVAVPVVMPDCKIDMLPGNMARAVNEFGDILGRYAEMIKDGKISWKEADRFEHEAFEAMQAIAAFNQAVQQVVK
jgi:hypothetical protein